MDINGIATSSSQFRTATFRAQEVQAQTQARADGQALAAVDPDRPTQAIRRALEPSEAGSASNDHAKQQERTEASPKPSSTARELSTEEQAQLARLQARDREVRAHENAHLGAAGGHAHGGASYTFEVGPDGRTYAIGGEVAIDMSAESSPEATLRKAETVARAALAPSDPSSADRQIAAAANRMAAAARDQIQTERREARESADASNTGAEAPPAGSESAPDDVVASKRTRLAQAYGRPAAEPQASSVACGSCEALHETVPSQ